MSKAKVKRARHDDEDYVEEDEDNDSDGFEDFVRREGGKDESEADPFAKRGRGAMQLKGKKGAGGGSRRKGADVLDEDAVVFHNYADMTLKPDHQNRPIWITPDEPPMVYLEAFSPHYQGAYDFLVAIGEPVSRPKWIHSYRLTEDSLYAAVALSLNTEKIMKTLTRLCKTAVPPQVESYINKCTYTFGKAKLVLKDNVFHVESQFPDVLRELLKNPVIAAARITEAEALALGTGSSGTGAAGKANADGFLEARVDAEDKRNMQVS